MYAQVIDNEITDVRGILPTAARSLVDGSWVCPVDGVWPEDSHEECGWFLVIDTPRPADTDSTTFFSEIQVIAGEPVIVWTERAKTPEELDAESAQAQAEKDATRNAAILEAIEATATPPEDGGAWVQPDGAHDAYPEGATVTHNGKTWVSLTPYNVWEPGVSGWREEVVDGYPEWVRPTGGHDAYNIGDRVTFEGQNYESVIAANVWSPTEYPAGWIVIT